MSDDRRKPLPKRLLLVLALTAAAAGGAIVAMTRTPEASARISTPTVSTSAEYQLVQYPQAGFGGIRRQIAAARSSIDMEMYELADPTTEQALVAAAGHGVRVRILLDKDFSGGEVNAAAYSYLRSHGVQVKWAPAGYIFHIKATSFDGTVSDISTANLTARYYTGTRDAEIIDRNPAQVKAIEATFANDWTAGPSGTPRTQTVQAPGLVWSPNTGSGTAETALLSEIARARTAIDFTSEELADPAIYDALAADAERRVTCRVVMTRSSDWDTAFNTLTRAGCHVRTFADSSSVLYVHEKLILDDPGTTSATMFLGSQNASSTSLTRNRELGIVLGRAGGGAAAISAAARTFDADFASAAPWGSSGSTSATPSTPATGAPTPSAPSAGSCSPRSAAGNCYRAGEYCSDADHGMSGTAADGEAITCEDTPSGWRWEPAS